MLAFLVAVFGSPSDLSAASCTDADNIAWVAGGGECLAIRTLAPKDPAPAPTLLVLVHGDTSDLEKLAEAYRERLPQFRAGRLVIVALTRPGFTDAGGRRSSGYSALKMRGGSYHEANPEAVAEAIDALRRHHRAGRVVVLGVSGAPRSPPTRWGCGPSWRPMPLSSWRVPATCRGSGRTTA